MSVRVSQMVVGAVAAAAIGLLPRTGCAQVANTVARVTALQGNAAQVSANIRAGLTGQGMIAEGLSSQDTQRLIQGDQVRAAQAAQFSTALCQDATGAAEAVAMGVAKVPVEVLDSQANALRTAGYHAAAVPDKMFGDRGPMFCRKDDPACNGTSGSRPNTDRMPGAILAETQLTTTDDQTQAKWVVQNLTQPVPTQALTASQVDQLGGKDLYLQRGGWETQLNLAKDVMTDILVIRRTPTGDPTYYNTLAAEAGLPQVTGKVSQADMDRMRFHDRFNGSFRTKLAGLGDPTVIGREIASLEADRIQEGYRTAWLLRARSLLQAAVMSLLVDGNIAGARGGLR